MASNGKFFELLTTSVAAGSTVRSAAAEHGCSESHAYHLSRTPEFRQRVAAVRTEALTAAVGRLTEASSIAVATLVELVGSGSDPSIRLQAAKAILASLGPISELGELRLRVDAIESQTVRSQKAA